jgi:hypothetical protein
MKAGPDLKKTSNTTKEVSLAAARGRDAGQYFKKRTFSRTIPTYDSNNLAGFNLE